MTDIPEPIRSKNSLVPLAVAAVCIMTISPSIAAAYAMQLGLRRPPSEAAIAASMNRSQDELVIAGVGFRSSNDESRLAHNFLTTLVKSARENRSLMVWSLYPASVRGRVFGGQGGNPFSSGSW